MTIAEVSKKYGLTQDTLRYYEKIGLIPVVMRNKSGIRNYSEEDCRWVEFIKCMRSAGLPIDALSTYVSLYQQGESTLEARKNILIEQRKILQQKMLDMQNTLNRLDLKITRYECLFVENDLLADNGQPGKGAGTAVAVSTFI